MRETDVMYATRFAQTFAALTLALTMSSGCAAMQGRGAHAGSHEPGIVLASSHLTKDGGLRLVAKVETGTYRLGKASLTYALGDPARNPPLASTGRSADVELVRPTTEAGVVDRDSGEVSFTLNRRALAELAERCLWYRWSVSLGGGQRGDRVLSSGFYRTSRGEAGLPRAADVPGPDTSFVVTAATGR